MEVKMSELESPKATKKVVKAEKSKKPLDLYGKPPSKPKPPPEFVPHMSEIPDELKHGVKDVVIGGMALGGRHNKKYLRHKLEQSKYINKYLERYLLLDQIGFLNDHAKFALAYGMLLFEANTLPELVLQPPKNDKV